MHRWQKRSNDGRVSRSCLTHFPPSSVRPSTNLGATEREAATTRGERGDKGKEADDKMLMSHEAEKFEADLPCVAVTRSKANTPPQ